ncbi:MAG: ATP-dependent metallopeptidase FtsH/Yme1/Tma family protein, partial [Allomuricauda sp.]
MDTDPQIEESGKNVQKPDNAPRPPFGSKGVGWIYWIVLIIILFFPFFSNQMGTAEEIGWTKFEETLLSENAVAKIVVVNKETAEIYLKKEFLDKPEFKENKNRLFASENGPHYFLTIGSVESFENKLQSAQKSLGHTEKIDVRYENRTNWTTVFSWLFPLILFVIFWVFMLRRMGGGGRGGGSLFNFGKSTARLTEKPGKSSVTFEDIAGLKEAKAEVMEVVDFLKHPEEYTRLGAKIPKGVLLVGPPGTGKTLMAKAVAGEAQVPFFNMSGSEFVEMFVGVGASRVRDLFKRAKEKAPSIIFIDEIDAVGRSRGRLNALQANDERESTLNQLLTELDGFGDNTGVIVLAATNRPDILDPALLRPGRFDRQVMVPLPELEDRRKILEVHTKGKKVGDDVDLGVVARGTPGMSGADLANLVNEAALFAARRNQRLVSMEEFELAKDKIMMGAERKSMVM